MAVATARPQGNGSTPTVEIGAPGLRIFYGRLDEEWLPDLKAPRHLKVYREMADNDPTIGSLLRAMTVLARQVEWQFTHADEDDPRLEALDHARRQMVQPWTDFVTEALFGQLAFGWSYHEIVYQRIPNGIGWKAFAPRAQDALERWVYRVPEERELLGLEQRPAPTYQLAFIPLTKALHIRSESRKDSPEGVSILRNCYRPWYFKKHIEQIEAIGVERDLAGLPVIYAPARLFSATPSAADTAVLDELKRIAVNIRRDEQEGVVMPLAYDEQGKELYKLSLLSTGGQRQFDTSAIIQRYDLRILQTAMADFLALGHEKVGSFALASSKTNLFSVSLGVYLDQIAAAFNTRAIPDFLELNGLPTEDPPTLTHGDIEQQDLAEYGTFLNACANAGMPLFPDRTLENACREKLGIPPLTAEEYAEREEERMAREQEQMQRQLAMAGAEENESGDTVAEKPKPGEAS